MNTQNTQSNRNEGPRGDANEREPEYYIATRHGENLHILPTELLVQRKTTSFGCLTLVTAIIFFGVVLLSGDSGRGDLELILVAGVLLFFIWITPFGDRHVRKRQHIPLILKHDGRIEYEGVELRSARAITSVFVYAESHGSDSPDTVEVDICGSDLDRFSLPYPVFRDLPSGLGAGALAKMIADFYRCPVRIETAK